ncbi:polysaccharide biosynthesis/export family protein [Hymenobacter sp. CRA2]|uniref:polysaccharide biosynthesis/export family protein n=1 Tax=Hymenobacter sp. CRA2 TaxID=1955620 RepID=UPI00098EFBE1|nr:polysaccharide biosynthesis/export family protein [Hymenobacter sp. CRA2]OON65682.1 hypothetical protein B0919_23700 [Hymenobacter sp. CRA2]
MLNHLSRLRLWPLVLLWLAACVPQSRLVYLQNPQYSKQTPVAVANEPTPYHIQPNDVLSVRVQSAQPALNDIFNVTDGRTLSNGDPGNMFLAGYSVDNEGNINLPTVGRVKLAGLTLEQAQQTIQREITKYARDSNVLVKLLSFKVTVLGDVKAPGRYFIYNGQANVLEALGMAGDLTEFGNRQNVKLVRQTDKGSAVVLLDLTDPNILASPYYYLLPNDALYVEPLRARTSRANASNFALVFAGISAVVLVLNYIKLL